MKQFGDTCDVICSSYQCAILGQGIVLSALHLRNNFRPLYVFVNVLYQLRVLRLP